MSKSIKDRIIGLIVVGAIDFVIFSVIYKLFIYREDWLLYSTIWSISWALGYFIAGCKILKAQKIWKRILYKLAIIFIVSILIAFIFGVLLNLPIWRYWLSNISVAFGASILLNGNWSTNN